MYVLSIKLLLNIVLVILDFSSRIHKLISRSNVPIFLRHDVPIFCMNALDGVKMHLLPALQSCPMEIRVLCCRLANTEARVAL